LFLAPLLLSVLNLQHHDNTNGDDDNCFLNWLIEDIGWDARKAFKRRGASFVEHGKWASMTMLPIVKRGLHLQRRVWWSYERNKTVVKVLYHPSRSSFL
jgi:hypothetical protein